MFSTDFVFRQQENLVDNQKCEAGFRPLCNKILLSKNSSIKKIRVHYLANHVHIYVSLVLPQVHGEVFSPFKKPAHQKITNVLPIFSHHLFKSLAKRFYKQIQICRFLVWTVYFEAKNLTSMVIHTIMFCKEIIIY